MDDDFVYESEEEENMLTYDDQGQSNVQVVAEINGKSLGNHDDHVEDKVSELKYSYCFCSYFITL